MLIKDKKVYMSSGGGQRSGELDFWKFVFSIIIVILHSEFLPVEIERGYFHGGSIFVEFFFIASGYLMAKSADRRKDYQSLVNETATFLRRKIVSFYPYLLFGFVLSLLIKSAYYGQWEFLLIVKNACKGIAELLLLKSTGMTGGLFDSPMWYISAMILSMAILYPMILKYGDFFRKIVCPLIAFFLLGYLYRKYAHFRAPEVWDGLFEKGTIRGFAELALGVYCYEIGKLLSNIKFTKISKILFAIVEYGSLIAIIAYSNTESCWDMDVPSVLLLAVSVIIICGNHSILASFWNKLKITPYLGKFSLMIYINHIYWVWFFDVIDLELSYQKMLTAYVCASVVSALICWFATDYICKILKKKGIVIKRFFIEA